MTTVAPCRKEGSPPERPTAGPPLPPPEDVDSEESVDGTTSAPRVARSFSESPLTPPGHGSQELDGHAYSGADRGESAKASARSAEWRRRVRDIPRSYREDG